MISQFIYGRCRTGYSQIGDVGQDGYTEEDISGFQLLWNYELAEGCDRNNRPECRNFYVSGTSAGPVVQVGRTAFVPAGTSQESGDRDTTLSHKYLFSQANYHALIKNPRSVFCIDNYCDTVEDALERRNSIPSFGGKIPEESTRELLEYFGIPEEDAENFIYGILDCVGNLDSRIYIALPEWNSRGTNRAMALCGKILSCFPPFLVSACGFLTYTKTFHNSQTNMIPRTVKVVFYPNNQENVRKYPSVITSNYIVDMKNGYMPVMETDDYTRELIRAFTACFLEGKKDNDWYLFFDSFGPRLPWDALFSPENLSCAYKFLQLLKELDEGWPTKFSIDEMYYIIENFLGCKAFSTVDKPAFSMLDRCERVMPIESDLLNIFCDYYMLMPSSKQMVIEKICRLLLNISMNKDMYLAVLNYAYEEPKLKEDVIDYLYHHPQFYSAALTREMLVSFEHIKAMENWEDQVNALYVRYEELAAKAPEFLMSPNTIDEMNRLAEYLCSERDKEMAVSLEKLGYLYLRDHCFRKEHQGFEGLSRSVITLMADTLKKNHLKAMGDPEIEVILGWMEDLEEDQEMPDLSYQFKYLKTRGERIEYLVSLRGTDGDACVEFWKSRGEEHSRKVLSRIRFDIYDLADRMEFKEEENYYQFFGNLFLIAGMQQREVLQLVMEDRDGLGGILGLSGVWNVIDKIDQEKRLCQGLMESVVKEYYDSHEVTASDIKEMKNVKEFLTYINADSYINEASVIGKLKNLGTLGGKAPKEKNNMFVTGWRSKDKEKKSRV
ncbi:MAG: hypothetical protein HFG70_00755 [Hungatella sp.]|nr:hypothetical protein [Hungatella sp.]